MKKEKMILLGALLVAFAVASIAPVMAEPAGGSVVGTATDVGPYQGTSASTIDITSGKIYLANVTGNMSTYHWAGVYGNATGYLILGDTNGNNKMFEWVAKADYVFFDNDNSISWSLDGISGSDVDSSSEYSFLSGASDSASNTFKNSESISFSSIPNPTNPAFYVITYSSGSTQWKTYVLNDTTNNDIVFAGKTVEDGTAYDGTTVNYQVILPENGNNGDTSATPYYVWLELY